ncbi:MAG: BMP family protein [Oscillospiraceae bacterium]|nr:BMP family protein [Oscillospiraceae bacterium]
MKRKALSFLICLALVGSLVLSGCGASTGTSSTAETTTPAATEAAAETTAATKTETTAETTAATATDVDYTAAKVAFVLPGSANDGSFNTKGYKAMLHLQELGCDCTYSENVSTDEQLEAIRDYAELGYNVIIGWGSQYDDDMVTVAAEYPEIQFCIASGTSGNDTNLTSVYVSGAHLGYGYGYLSALVSKSNKVAFIGANQGNQAYTDEVCGFIAGAKACNPDIEVTILYVADYSDVAEAQETAKLCVENGCDVMFADISEGYYGMLDVAMENGIYTFGRNADNIASYPTGCIAYIENNWGTKMEDVVTNYLTKGLLHGVTEVGFGTVVRGWDYHYDTDHEFNPDLITDEMAAKFQTNVIEKITKEGYTHNYTAADANPGVY